MKTSEVVSSLDRCVSCGKPIFRPGVDFPFGSQLPKGLTAGNAKMVVWYHGNRLEVCANCRYDKYGAW